MIRFPSFAAVLTVLLVVLAGLGAGLGALWIKREFFPVNSLVPAPTPSLEALRDSVLRARVTDSVALVARVDSILDLRGDSLAAAFARKAAALRPRIIRIPGVPDTVRDSSVVHDSVCLDGGDARDVLIALEACGVDRDAFHGELVVCQASDSAHMQELRERPTSCHGWSAFGLGFGLGAVAGVSGCGVGR